MEFRIDIDFTKNMPGSFCLLNQYHLCSYRSELNPNNQEWQTLVDKVAIIQLILYTLPANYVESPHLIAATTHSISINLEMYRIIV